MHLIEHFNPYRKVAFNAGYSQIAIRLGNFLKLSRKYFLVKNGVFLKIAKSHKVLFKKPMINVFEHRKICLLIPKTPHRWIFFPKYVQLILTKRLAYHNCYWSIFEDLLFRRMIFDIVISLSFFSKKKSENIYLQKNSFWKNVMREEHFCFDEKIQILNITFQKSG